MADRLDIDQTSTRMENVQDAIDDDPRQIFVHELDISTNSEYSSEPAITKRQISGTIYMADRSVTGGFPKTAGGVAVARLNYYLLTTDEIKNKSKVEMEGNFYEVEFVHNIRGNYKRAKLRSVEYGKKIRGYT
jgi:hypothetical protein